MTDLVDGIIDDDFLQTEFGVNDPLLRRRFLKACQKLSTSPTSTPGGRIRFWVRHSIYFL
eukprot:CAMPEP_0201506178 /NCGR_PEP_ID=MMETSP0161_2-20130828/114_1 /ASSEMBLY_ACC=CAM_ASM_000251 /TAXON_ID=180227 /ORGANISM="Neoparamoeba aestuarina, Strain SoJaBio B1-5/56/2" /LENGTH=59 /DNA_ID=CAMNT_0047900207 /DNA_START=179 /DNA_END=355 /DNA_ORIENTATION=+